MSHEIAQGDRDEAGASAVEYGLMVAGIAAVIVLTLFALGGIISDLFDTSCGTVGGQIQANNPSVATCG